MVNRIERDEWNHRRDVRKIMKCYGIPINRWYEFQCQWIGRMIGLSCHFIGRFMPYFFAGNVCEYFVMLRQFHS